MALGEALQVALALHRQPALNAAQRSVALPQDVSQVLRIALGNADVLSAAVEETGASIELLQEASRFFVEQQLLAREFEGDPWRVLGVSRGATDELIKEHRHLLVGLVHPDRSTDWEPAYADRVHRAWRSIKLQTAESGSSTHEYQSISPQGGAWGPSTHSSEASDVPSESVWNAAPAVQAAPIDDECAEVDSHVSALSVKAPAAFGRSGILIGGIVTVVIGGLIAWTVFDADWAGDEVLVHLDESPSRASVAKLVDAAEMRPKSEAVPETARNSDVARSVLPDSAAPSSVLPAEESVAAVTVLANRDAATASAPSGSRPVSSSYRPESVSGIASIAQPKSRDDAQPSIAKATTSESEAALALRTDVRQSPSPDALGDARDASKPVAIKRSQAPAVQKDVAIAAAAVVGLSETPQAPRVEIAGASELASPAPQIPESVSTDASVRALLGAFSEHYAKGDLSSLIGLFSPSANQSRGGNMGLAADYSRLFSDTREREIDINQVSWHAEHDGLRGDARFEARYRKQGRISRQTVSGQISFVMVHEGGVLRILQFATAPADR